MKKGVHFLFTEKHFKTFCFKMGGGRLVLLAILILQSISANAQCGTITQGCLSQYPNGICIGSNVGLPKQSTLGGGLQSNVVYFVTGSFAMDVTNTQIVGTTFVMDAQAQLIIGPATNSFSPLGSYISLQECRIRGCRELWRNVQVKANWTLLLGRSLVEDSWEGINPVNGGNLTCRETIFRDNHTAITLNTGISVSSSIVQVYTSEFTSTSKNLLPSSYQNFYTKPARGIYVQRDVPGLFVGSCYFNNMNNDIVLSNSNVLGSISSNNVFKDISQLNGAPAFGTTGNAISHTGQLNGKTVTLQMQGKYNPTLGSSSPYTVGVVNTPFTTNTSYQSFNQNFINCYRGLRVQDARTSFINNDMISCIFGVVVTATGPNKFSEINNNRIREVGNVGVDLIGNSVNFTALVQNNLIVVEPSLALIRVGIRHLNTFAGNNTQPVGIKANTIKLGLTSSATITVQTYGIQITGVAGTNISDLNNISVTNPNMNYIGILVNNNSDAIRIVNNLLSAQDQTSNVNSVNRIGILLNEAEFSDIRCNRFTLLGRGLNLYGECAASSLQSNIFVSGVQGLVYGNGSNIEALSGAQYGASNRWLKPNGYTQQQARFTGDIALFNGQNSRYYVHDDDIPLDIEYWPNTKLPVSFWFFEDTNLPFPVGGCITGAVNPGNELTGIVNDIVNNNTSNWPNDDYLLRTSRWHTYSYLDKYPAALAANSSAQNYLTNQANTPTKKLWDVSKAISQVGLMNQATTNSLDLLYAEINQRAADISVMVQSWDVLNPSTSLNISLSNELAQYEIALNSIENIWASQGVTNSTALTLVDNQLNAITVTNQQDINQKFTMGMELKRALDPDYVPSIVEVNQLLALAGQCHRIGGTGVLEARNILSIFNIDGIQEDPLSCFPAIQERNQYINLEVTPMKEILLYPNPGSKELNIEFKLVEGAQTTIEFRNNMGILVKSVSTNASKVNINTSDMISGIYNVLIIRDGQSVVTERWLKN